MEVRRVIFAVVGTHGKLVTLLAWHIRILTDFRGSCAYVFYIIYK